MKLKEHLKEELKAFKNAKLELECLYSSVLVLMLFVIIVLVFA